MAGQAGRAWKKKLASLPENDLRRQKFSEPFGLQAWLARGIHIRGKRTVEKPTEVNPLDVFGNPKTEA